MRDLAGKVAVVTGGGSGIGRGTVLALAEAGMHVVVADIEEDAALAVAAEVEKLGPRALGIRTDVTDRASVDALANVAYKEFGTVHVLHNNAGVALFQRLDKMTDAEWRWLLSVNLEGVVNGIQTFLPRFQEQDGETHIVNTASMAGMCNMPNMGVYNVTKHAVVAMSESLYQDLALVTTQIHCSVLCPYFVPTGIHHSERNRPAEMVDSAAQPTASQLIAQAMNDKAIGSGKVSAAQVAQFVFDAVAEERFYVFSHPNALGVVQTRLEDIVLHRNPTDPFKDRPQVGQRLRDAIRDAG